MDLGLKGRSAIVCAASQGLGYAVAEELAGEGARVVICSRNSDRVDDARRRIVDATGGEVYGVTADLGTAEGCKTVFREAVERLGSVDILVNNTGGPPPGRSEDLSVADWELATRNLLTSVVELTRLVLPGMRAAGWGRILNVTSISVKQPIDNLMLSNSLRAAVTGFARTLANEVAEFDVTVNNILPGYTSTERVEQLARSISDLKGVSVDDAKAEWEAQIPMRRLGTPREFAALAAFLVSDRASYITGTSVPVDGGWTRTIL